MKFLLATVLGSLIFSVAANADSMEKGGKQSIIAIKTSMGDIKVKLLDQEAPETVKNFLRYVADGHYNNTVFHRVIKGFMIQGGGFDAKFDQKPTRSPIKNEADNRLSNKRGTLAMARTPEPHSAAAQFFINVADNKFLDFSAPTTQQYGYCVFGKVIEGMDVVDKIAGVRTGFKNGHQDAPNENVVILEVVKD
jgi:cyclophilin family peptidyl-prolyl cis-trans isomerase